MKIKKYCNEINYNRKWCLYKLTEFNTYTSIYVIAECDGIIKYVYEHEPSKVNYSDIEEFENCYSFFVNPIQMDDPTVINNSRTFTYDNSFTDNLTSCDSPGYMDHDLNQ